ncbi:hypothetical protein [Pectobacterium sp. B2J-2]|uniref:hypothetical protein n=1 Tax=Pectobacterium sp. B2J-2 TaxID=3385372 RepID=UPI0038FC7E13
MKRNKFLAAITLACMQVAGVQAAATAFPSAAVPLADGKQPNEVYIILDDQPYDAFGFLNSAIHTLNMDSIAREGTYFKNAFVTTSLCSPQSCQHPDGDICV